MNHSTRMQASWLKIGSLAMLFFLLSVKGEQNINQLQDWETVNLPTSTLWIKHSANQLGVLFLGIVALLSVRRRFSFSLSLPATILSSILSWYYLRSAFVGSGTLLNYAAIVTLFVWLFVAATDSGKSNNKLVEQSLVYFSTLHIAATTWLTLSGYGYTLEGATNRLYGLAYHPNMLGAVSALSSSVFLFRYYADRETRRSFIENYVFPVLAIAAFALVILSGSRTAILMSLVPIAFILPPRVLTSLSVISAVLLLTGGFISIMAPETPWGAAINRMLEAPLDNRQGVWQALVSDFNDYPIWGAGDKSGVSASSYLTAFSGTGLVGGFLFIIIMLTSALGAVRRIALFRLRRTPRVQPHLYDYIFLQISVGAFFEAYIFDKFGLIQLLSIWAINNISNRVKFR